MNNEILILTASYDPFTDTQGNLAHIHAILRTQYNIDNPNELNIVLSKIRGCVIDLIHHEEYVRMKESGIISSLEHLLEIYDQFQTTVFFITHDLDEAIFLADTVVVMTTRPGPWTLAVSRRGDL